MYTRYLRGKYKVRIFKTDAGAFVNFETENPIFRGDNVTIGKERDKFIIETEDGERASFSHRDWEEFPDSCFVRQNEQVITE